MYVYTITLIDVQFYYQSSISRYIGQTDSVTISIWNHKKIHKKQGAGFLGCVRIMSNAVTQLKDTGCKYINYTSSGVCLIDMVPNK